MARCTALTLRVSGSPCQCQAPRCRKTTAPGKNSPGGSPDENSAASHGPRNKYTLYSTCNAHGTPPPHLSADESSRQYDVCGVLTVADRCLLPHLSRSPHASKAHFTRCESYNERQSVIALQGRAPSLGLWLAWRQLTSQEAQDVSTENRLGKWMTCGSQMEGTSAMSVRAEKGNAIHRRSCPAAASLGSNSRAPRWNAHSP